MAPAASHALKRRSRATRRKRARSRRRGGSLRGWLAFLVVVAVALIAGFLLIRDSSLVAVESVKVTGLVKGDPKGLEGAISRAAREMTTLHIDNDALARIAARYATVKKVSAKPVFPNKLKLEVIHHSPVAVISTTEGTAALTRDGTVVEGLKATKGLPRIQVQRKLSGSSVRGRMARASLALLVATPSAWRERIRMVYVGPKGLTVALRDGPKIYFGAGSDPALQWRAAARLLAEPSVRAATYIDVSSSERPAVGGLGAEPLGGQPGTAPGQDSPDPANIVAPPTAAGKGPAEGQIPASPQPGQQGQPDPGAQQGGAGPSAPGQNQTPPADSTTGQTAPQGGGATQPQNTGGASPQH